MDIETGTSLAEHYGPLLCDLAVLYSKPMTRLISESGRIGDASKGGMLLQKVRGVLQGGEGGVRCGDTPRAYWGLNVSHPSGGEGTTNTASRHARRPTSLSRM